MNKEIDIKTLKVFAKKYINKYSDTIDLLFKSLEEENKTVYDKDARLIVEGFFKYNTRWMSLAEQYDITATESFKNFWKNMIVDCQFFLEDNRQFAVIACSHTNPAYKKLAAKLQRSLTNIDDLAAYSQMELCQMLKQNKIGIQGIITTLNMMCDFDVMLSDCDTQEDMKRLIELLEVISSKGGE